MNIDKAIELILVEDNTDDAELILRVLKKRGFYEKTLYLSNGEEALTVTDILNTQKSFSSVRPKLIILDIKMPKVDGFTVLRALKSNEFTQMVPVLIFSSSNQEKDIKLAYELGANCYVEKPLEYEEFVLTVERIIDFWMMINTTIRT